MFKQQTPAAKVARMEHLVTTTTRSLRDIALELEVHQTTVGLYAARCGWARPEGAPPLRQAPRGAARVPAGSDPVDIATLVAECLGQLKGQLTELRRGHAKGGSPALTDTLRAVTDTTRTLKELARAAATLQPPAAAARNGPDDDLDDEQFAAVLDGLADAFGRWMARRGGPFLPRNADAADGA